MGTVTVHHLHQRLRLGPQGQAQRQRVDRLLDGLWQHALASALDRLGLGPHGELCIRRLVLPAWRLDLDAADDRLLASWAQAWAQAIALRAARPDEGLWHYASRAQALADLTLAASAGDLGRAWAWRQLGLWPAARGVDDDALTAADIAGLVARALTAQPLAAPAVLALLARRPAAFGRWWPAAAGALPGLAQAVLRAAGASASVWTQGLAEPGTARLAPDAAAAWARVLGGSPIAHALQVSGTAAHAAPSPAQALALAVLALAQAEPAWLRAATAPLAGLLAQLAAHWRPPGLPSGRAAGAVRQTVQGTPADALATPPSASHGARSAPPRQAIADADADAATAPGPAPEPTADRRARGHTRYGGLLYLLNLAAALGWPERLLDDAVLAARGPRWALHRLAMQLVPLAADDAAALGFAGLLPGQAPPAADPPPTAAESEALARWHGALLRALRQRLVDAPSDDDALLAWVCRREAECVADPGWLEVQLSLADVDTALRAAGLDLDPGWLPWLGLVVRFVYG